MSEYIGNRIVPRHDGGWQAAKAVMAVLSMLLLTWGIRQVRE